VPPWLEAIGQILQPATPVATLAFAVYLILSGKIVARSVVDNIREDRDARVNEAREQTSIWREAYRESEKARQTQHDLLKESLEGVHAITHLLESHRPELPPAGGDMDVR
jgi:hypothetical protein